jgi:hypothetical protein
MPTQLIKKYVEEFAKWLRNQTDYDDFEYGTEVIPGDKTWVKSKKCNNCGSCSCKINSKKES